MQTIEKETSFMLPFIAPELKNIFGPQAATSMFIDTTVRKFLFDGIEFCRDPVGVPKLVCDTVESRKSQTIVKTDDGMALKFSMFSHVCSSIIFLFSNKTNA